jgi:hypothetical protein
MRPVVRLLFAGLWTIADREGRLEDRPVKIQAAVLPYDHINVDKALAELAAAGFVHRYSVGEQHYIQICTWRKHQRPHPREEGSTIPAEGSTKVNHEDAPGSGPGPSRTSSSSSSRTFPSRTYVLASPPPPPPAEGETAPDKGGTEEKTNGHTTDACCLLGELSGGEQHSNSCQANRD